MIRDDPDRSCALFVASSKSLDRSDGGIEPVVLGNKPGNLRGGLEKLSE